MDQNSVVSRRTLAALLLATLASPAFAQEDTMAAPPKDYQDFFGLGTKQLKIWGSFHVEETYDSNILLSEEDEESDLYTSLMPALHLRFDHSDEAIQFDYLGRDRIYSDFDEFDGMEHYQDGLVKMQAGKFRVELFNHFKARKDPFDVLQVTDRLDSTQMDLGALLAMAFNGLDVELTGMTRRFTIDNSVQDRIDHRRKEMSVLIAVDVHDKTQVLAEVGTTDTVYDEDDVLNNWTSLHAVGGFRTEPSGKLRGTVKAGMVKVESDDNAVLLSDDETAPYLSMAIDWDALPNGMLRFSALRQPVESIFTGVTMVTHAEIEYSHSFSERAHGSAALVAESASEVSSGLDDRSLYTVRFSTRLLPADHFSVTGMIEYRTKMSDTDVFEFSDLRASVGAGVEF